MEHQGIVARRTKGYYYLRNTAGEEVECKVKGRLFKSSRFNNQIAVGDQVEYRKTDDDHVGLIHTILPRKSFLSRSRVGIEAEQVIAANIDYLLITASAKDPMFRANLVNRMLVAAEVGNITPVLVITKADLIDEESIHNFLKPYREIDLEILITSTKSDKNHDRLFEILKNSITVLSGQSGVGKSSLLNKLFPGLDLKVGAISERTMKGSHTTTYATMHQIMDNSYVVDTPGIRGFGLWKVNQENLMKHYPKIKEFVNRCRHRDCRHVHEPKCAVKEAVQKGDLDKAFYDGYVSVFDSLVIDNR